MPRAKLNVVELAMLAGLVVFLTYWATRYTTESRLLPFLSRSAPEVQSLKDAYGPSRNSRYAEEWMIRDFFRDRREGVFVDVGANHYQRDSNTYYLETQLGWSGVAVEPQVRFAADYASHRPRTRFVPMFVSDTSNGRATLFVPKNNHLIASSNSAFVEREGGKDVEPQSANTTTLDDVLEAAGIRHIDFLSIDIELHEPAALKGFSIDRYKPGLVCIEAHPQVRQQILDYFTAHGYVPVAKYLRADTENLWFMPAGSSGPAPSDAVVHSH